MTHEFQQMLQLAALGTTGHSINLDYMDIDWQKVIETSKKQRVDYFVAYAIKNHQMLTCSSEIQDPLIQDARRLFFSNAIHKRAIIELLEKMERSGIHGILLKGYAIADCYTLPESRTCGDVDIWIEPKDEERACEFMKKQEFTVIPRWKNGHHAVCNHPMLGCVELHIILYDEIVEDVWFGKMDGSEFVIEPYKQVVTQDGKFFTLGTTDHFIFLVLHMIKHFIISGLTVQMMLDVALYFKKYKAEIDIDRFWNTLHPLHYDRLMNCILWAMIQYCGFSKSDFPGVCDEAPDMVETILTDLEEGGWMGDADKQFREEGWHEYNRQVMLKSKSRVYYYLYMMWWKMDQYRMSLFPSREKLMRYYPYISKHVFLLPLAWLHHLIFRGIKAVKQGALTTYVVVNTEKLSDSGKKRIHMFRDLGLM